MSLRLARRPAQVRGPAAPFLAGDRAPQPTKVWWLNPAVMVILLTTATILMTIDYDPSSWRRNFRMPKAIPLDGSLLFLAGGLLLALFALIPLAARPARPRPGRWPALAEREQRLLRKASAILFPATLVGYLGILSVGVLRGVTLADLLASFSDTGNYGLAIEDKLGTVPGLTTLTQVGMASVTVSAVLYCATGRRRELAKILMLLLLSLGRAFFLTERLATLELLIPLAAVFLARAASRPLGRRLVAWTPVAAVPAVVAVFGAFEYGRSWVFYRQFGGSFASFAVERLAGYYVTAYNNGYLEMIHSTPAGRWPFRIMEWFWRAPVVDDLRLLETLDGYDPYALTAQTLAQFGNPEFNNLSGIGIVYADLGMAGGLVYFALAGLVIGACYRSFLESGVAGLLFYPLIFLGIVELPLILHWAEGRTLPTLAALGLVYLVHRRSTRIGKVQRA